MSNAQGGSPRWALVLGVSSGFGAECGLALAAAGYDICGVHLDRKAGLARVAEIKGAIEKLGRRALFFNYNAADAEKRAEVLSCLEAEHAKVYVLLHSLAFGALKPFIGDDAVNEQQMDMTLSVMAHSLVYWTQEAHRRGLLQRGARVFSMTSSGSTRAIASYGAVSAAKAALESHTRQLAYELAEHGHRRQRPARGSDRHAGGAEDPRERQAVRGRGREEEPGQAADDAAGRGRGAGGPVPPRRGVADGQRDQRGRRRGDLSGLTARRGA